MNFSNTKISCGVKQLYGFYRGDETPADQVKQVAKELGIFRTPDTRYLCPESTCETCAEIRNNPTPRIESRPTGAAFVIFSDVLNNKGAREFAAFLRNNNLGQVIFDTAINPNSGNEIAIWVWRVDHEAVADWCRRELC